MDQDSRGGIFAYIGLTFLGAVIQWLFSRMWRIVRPKEPLTFSMAAVEQINARFDNIDEALQSMAETQRGQEARIVTLERRRHATGD